MKKLALILFVAVTQLAHAVCLSGTYTIGGITPDFPTITAAVNSLTASGMCGSVTFNIRTGTYSEGVTLGTISGLSGANTLTFQSESGDSTSVVWALSTGITLKLNGADNIIIRKLTLGADGLWNTYSTIDLGPGGSNNIEISHCVLAAQDFSQAAIYASSSTPGSNIRILNNFFISGDHSISVSTTGGTFFKNVRVEHNAWSSSHAGYGSVYLGGVDTLSYQYNVSSDTSLTMLPSSGSADFEHVKDALIKHNKIATYEQIGIRLDDVMRTTVADNVILVRGLNNTAIGIVETSAQYLYILNNSVKVSNTSSIGVGLQLSGGYPTLHTKVWNNIFVNTGGGYAIALYTAGADVSLKRNVYYTSGAFLAQTASSSLATLADWQAYAPADSGAMNLLPVFTSTFDLHSQTYALNNAGVNVSAYITDDYDGLPRSSTPDIGAFEFTPVTGDAGISGMPAALPLCSGISSLQVTLKNYGIDTLRSADVIYSVNTALQPSHHWTGNLAPGQQELVTVGSYNFAPATAYILKFWPVNPNAGTDMVPANDTLTRSIAAPALHGTYTIGGTVPDYTTVSAAAHALSAGGICGPVVFNIRSGTYPEQVRIGNIAGTSAVNTVTFQSEALDSTAVSIEYSASAAQNYTVKVDSADHVIFNKLSIRSQNSSNAGALLYSNTARNGEIKSCIIEGPVSGNGILLFLSINSDSCLVTNTKFINASDGISFEGAYNRALNNYFEGQTATGITGSGTDLRYASNTINYNTGTSAATAILITGTVTGGVITKNKIVVTGGGKGLDVSNGSTSAGLEISNNFISVDGGYGLYFGPVTNLKIYFNSVYQKGNGDCVNFHSTYAGTFTENNIWYNTGPASGFCINKTGSSLAGSFLSDYNCVYSTGGRYATNGSMVWTNLDSYSLYFAEEAGSVSSDPLFTSFTDLHARHITLIDGADPAYFLPDDIDGDLRNPVTPVMGADEFVPAVTDVWPGDANNDHTVDNTDLLPIGLFFNENGGGRGFSDNSWTAHPSADWGLSESGGVDIKHADCNGDATINDADTLAVDLNFSSYHALPPAPWHEHYRSAPDFYWHFNDTSYAPGDWVIADLYVGDSTAAVPALYGLAFDISYNASLVQTGTEQLSYPASWLGTVGINALSMSKTDPSAEIAYGALVRTDHVNATGNGKIATFRFQLRTDLTAADSAVVLSVPFYVAVLANSDTVRFNLTDGSAAVHVLSTGIYENNAAADFNSYPNPYSDHTTIHYTTGHSAMVTVEIYDMTGQRVATLFNGKQDGGKHSLDFAAGKAGLDVGMYLVKLTVDGKTQLKRIIETR